MKHKASLLLMEQLVMILVFALAAVLCLRTFAGADRISRETLRQDRAVLLAQNGAEAVKAAAGDLDRAAAILGASREGDHLIPAQEELRLQIRMLPSEVPGLAQAEIAVLAEGEEIFSLVAAWQEVAQ